MFFINSSILNSTAKDIFELIKQRENITLLWLPGGGRSHFAHNVQSKIGLSSYIPDKILNKITFLFIDFDSDFETFKDQIKDAIEVYTDTTNINKGMNMLTKSNNFVYYIVDNFVFEKKKLQYLNLLRSIAFEKTRFIFLTSFAELFYSQEATLATEKYMYHNVINIPYFDKKKSAEWAKISCFNLNLRSNDELIQRVVEFCGGVPSFIKNYLRIYKRLENFEQVEDSDEINTIITSTWNAYSEIEKKTLKRLYITRNSRAQYPRLLEYFKKNNLIDSRGSIIGEWSSKVFEKSKNVIIEYKSGELMWDGYNFTDRLNIKERQVLIKLIESSKIITRESIGEIVYEGHYTEWSIDKFISRLRKKLFEIGIGKDKIQTVKGEGYHSLNIKLVK